MVFLGRPLFTGRSRPHAATIRSRRSSTADELGGGAMKSFGTRMGLFTGTAAVVLLGLGVVGAAPAGAAPRAINPVGLYNYFDGGIITEGGAATTITVN